jgi:hypothetical protein
MYFVYLLRRKNRKKKCGLSGEKGRYGDSVGVWKSTLLQLELPSVGQQTRIWYPSVGLRTCISVFEHRLAYLYFVIQAQTGVPVFHYLSAGQHIVFCYSSAGQHIHILLFERRARACDPAFQYLSTG